MTDHGEVWFSTKFDPQRGRSAVRITRADPRALVGETMLAEIAKEPGALAALDGDVLTLSDDYGQRFIYRIGRYLPEVGAYEMEWPD